MKEIQNWLRPLLFTLGGAAAGYMYYYFIGCASGCAIASSPVRSMIYLAAVGALLGLITDRRCNGQCTV